MKKIYVLLMAGIALSCALDKKGKKAKEEKLVYPVTRTCDSTATYFGSVVKDPYGWLEDDYSEETNAWVKAQNKVTEEYLQNIPQREKIRERLAAVWNYEKYGIPQKKAGITYYSKNNGIQNQSVLYKIDEKGNEVVVLDPNTFSKEGTIALGSMSFSKDGKYLAYATAQSGSDWETIQVLDLTTGKTLEDKIDWVKFSGISWQDSGFYYSRYNEPAKGDEYSQKNEFHKIYFHQLGNSQDKDKLVYEDRVNGQRNFYGGTTKDEEYFILQGSESTSGNSFYFRKKGTERLIPIDTDFKFEYNVIGHYKGKLYVLTNNNAPNWRLIAIDPAMPESGHWQTVIPESEHLLQNVSLASGMLLVTYLENVVNHLYTYNLSGKRTAEINLPPMGTVNGIEADENESTAFISYTNFTTPTSIYKIDVNTARADIYRKPEIDFEAGEFETRQVFYTSRDGTKVPMFITHKKGLKMNGKNPTFLYGYGGFNISIQPSFSIDIIPFLENGGVYAVANIRGGSEYGEDWHQGGIKTKKQNVFDDFIAAAEYLIKEKVTSSEKLAIHGRSNGGLLVGAVLTQRPDLFKVALPKVGVLDMLRYHKFTIGWAWASDYGRSDESKEMFEYLSKYSPLHNVKKAAYPATMIVTGDHDDRVVPAHSFKFAATLQANQTGTEPVIIRIDTNAGHGSGKPVTKQIAEYTDQWAFVFKHLGID